MWLGKVKNIDLSKISHESRNKWEAEKLAGELLRCLLCIFDTELTTTQQLEMMSTLGHLLAYLTFGTGAHSKFLPLQLYHDLQAVVKNAFFTTAKAQAKL
jgi:hypothetical protein